MNVCVLVASVWRAGGESYPERPDEPDCIYYLRTGACGYGSRCRFNHPRDRGAVIKVFPILDSVPRFQIVELSFCKLLIRLLEV